MNKINTAIIGATGYAGVELLDALWEHPFFNLIAATGTIEKKEKLSHIYSSLIGRGSDIFLTPLDEFLDDKELLKNLDLIFLAVPHRGAMKVVIDLKKFNGKIVDLSGDFRLKDVNLYENAYGTKHLCPELLSKAVYALPEIISYEEIKTAKLISCPGCYPTASILGIIPLANSSYFLEGQDIIVDAKSGISGGGKGFNEPNHYCFSDESIMAYKVFKHQHKSEIEEKIKLKTGKNFNLIFTPHLIPMKRGILSTIYIKCKKDTKYEDILKLYKETYKGAFVNVLEEGLQPSTNSVTYTNNCQIGISYDSESKMAIITSAIDNLGKGASLQAIQVANIAFALKEDTGLKGKFKVI